MLVKEIMTKNVVTIEADASVFDACMMYKEKKVGCLVVVDDETCVGIVTITDIAEARPEISKRFMETWMKAQWRD